MLIKKIKESSRSLVQVSKLTFNNSVLIETKVNSLVFISDLHFDFTKRKFKAKAASQIKDDFISFIKQRYADSIICLAGDFFNNYKKTLAFVKELEQNQIVGFFVLGNHDFWNNGTKSHTDVINLFDAETQNNKYFRFLITGRKYYIKDICFIGDTGWTSFKRGKRRVALRQFMNLPDAKKVKDFSPKKILTMHEEWISYANDILNQEKKVIIITHFPMVDFTQVDKDCWWSSNTNLSGENSWRIYGHTHKRTHECKEQQNNNVSSQRGYDNIQYNDLHFNGFKQYSSYDFGELKRVMNDPGIVESDNFKIISNFYSSFLVSNTNRELETVSKIKKRGYKRCSSNKNNFAVLANSPKMYLQRVKQVINWYLKDTYIGYTLLGRISKSAIDSIFSSIQILEKENYTNIRAFMTAAVITGYVYNGMPYLIESMRPLDDYDIIRFWLMFLTIKQYKINKDRIYTVRKDGNNHIIYCNVEIYLPAVNGLALTVDEVQELMQQTPLLPNQLSY